MERNTGHCRRRFEAAWDALASAPGPGHRGNFLFARHAVGLLEVACRLCKSDATGLALADFSARLETRDHRYFTLLPGACWSPSTRTHLAFELPSRESDPDNQIIAALFNLIRNGQAHQYQQMGAVLAHGLQFRISLTGAQHGAFLWTTFSHGRPSQHVSVALDRCGNLWMTALPDVLFLDVRDSIREADLLNRGFAFQFMAEDRKQTFYFTAVAAETVLGSQGHWS